MIKSGKTPSTKCFDGKAPINKPKASLNKRKAEKVTKLKKPESNYDEEYSFPVRHNHMNTEDFYISEHELEIENQRIQQKQCKACKQHFPNRLFESHLRVCQLMSSRNKQHIQQKRQISKSSKIRGQSKLRKKEQPLVRKQTKPKREQIKKQLRKKDSYQNQIGQQRRNQQPITRTSVRRQTNQKSRPKKQSVRPRSNLPRQRTGERRRESSHQRINGMFPMNFFQQINIGGVRIPNLNQIMNIGNDIANMMENVTNLININIPRRGRVIWYQNEQPDESFTEIYYDSPQNYPEGLDQQQINQIPVYRYRATQNNSNSHTTNKSCAVCLSDFHNGEHVKTLQCQHRYHQQCIDKWLELKGSCPVCRNDLH